MKVCKARVTVSNHGGSCRDCTLPLCGTTHVGDCDCHCPLGHIQDKYSRSLLVTYNAKNIGCPHGTTSGGPDIYATTKLSHQHTVRD